MDSDLRIRWNDWGPAAFSRADREGKLVLLDISATWCHWCHVLDRTSLSDPDVVRLVRDEFVPVRVDTDRRPDVNDRYNQGGWPTVAVLLPDGTLLAGATYLPPDALASFLTRCARLYREERPLVERQLREARDARAAGEEGAEGRDRREPLPEDLALVRHAVLAAYDPVHPGFFREPKFLVPHILSYLRDAWKLDGSREAGDAFLAVLRRMASSGVIDGAEGGFFRYATKRDWTAPHYEKLLPDNAGMLALYADAFAATGEDLFRRTAAGIVRFLFTKLYEPVTGAFMASQDADEEYYRLPALERARRTPPPIDRTIFTEYNGAAVSALVAAHRAFDSAGEFADGYGADFLRAAERLAEFLRRERWTEGEGAVRFVDDAGARHAGLLADNVSLADAALDLHEATGDGTALSLARDVMAWCGAQLFSAAGGAFADRRRGDGDFGSLSVPLFPFDANARAVRAIARLERRGPSPVLRSAAERTLAHLAAEFDRQSVFGAPYGSALLAWRGDGAACRPGDPSCGPGGAAVA